MKRFYPVQWTAALVRKVTQFWKGRYRPERHYMRGRGPASEKQKLH